MVEADERLAAQQGDGPDLTALREANARALELMVDDDGWPTLDEAGEDGLDAALSIVRNATTRPLFQRRCLTLVKAAAAHGEVPEGYVERMERAL